MALTLYGGPKTRASMPRWYLEEKGIPYNLVELDLRGYEHRQPDYLPSIPLASFHPWWTTASSARMDSR